MRNFQCVKKDYSIIVVRLSLFKGFGQAANMNAFNKITEIS